MLGQQISTRFAMSTFAPHLAWQHLSNSILEQYYLLEFQFPYDHKNI